MKLDRVERRKHLQLHESCDERGVRYSYNLIGLLALKLNTTFPQKGNKALVCHACNNPKCSNINHLYWGSYADNKIDLFESKGKTTPYEQSVLKYGTDKASNILKNNGSLGGLANKGVPKSKEHKEKIAKSLLGKKRK